MTGAGFLFSMICFGRPHACRPLDTWPALATLLRFDLLSGDQKWCVHPFWHIHLTPGSSSFRPASVSVTSVTRYCFRGFSICKVMTFHSRLSKVGATWLSFASFSTRNLFLRQICQRHSLSPSVRLLPRRRFDHIRLKVGHFSEQHEPLWTVPPSFVILRLGACSGLNHWVDSNSALVRVQTTISWCYWHVRKSLLFRFLIHTKHTCSCVWSSAFFPFHKSRLNAHILFRWMISERSNVKAREDVDGRSFSFIFTLFVRFTIRCLFRFKFIKMWHINFVFIFSFVHLPPLTIFALLFNVETIQPFAPFKLAFLSVVVIRSRCRPS